MERWSGKVAIVTGATAGIGRAIAERLAQEGLQVVAAGRRKDRLEELQKKYKGRIHPVVTDITKEEDIVRLFKWTADNLGAVHVLVNNAGTAVNTQVAECDTKIWRMMFDLNVIGLGITSREALSLMKKKGINDGYIINISSISGHGIPEGLGKHVYNATKNAVRIITEGLRQELAEAKSKIKVSSISPGYARTEIFEVGGWNHMIGNTETPQLEPEDLGEAVVTLLSTKSDVLICDLLLRPMGERSLA